MYYGRIATASLIVTVCVHSVCLSAQFASLHSFAGPDGRLPSSSLTALGTRLFGAANGGGDNGTGVVFRYDTIGGQYVELHHFEPYPPSDGLSASQLTSVGSTLYATTPYGGISDGGTLISIDAEGGGFKKHLDFSVASGIGNQPNGPLAHVGTSLYGVTRNIEGQVRGSIFKWDMRDGELTTVHTFGGRGNSPVGSFVQVGSLLYGASYTGGQFGSGYLYTFDPSSGHVENIFSLQNEPWISYLNGNLLLAGSSIYGTAGFNGALYRLDVTTHEVTILHRFTGMDGKEPSGSMVFHESSIYGTTWSGGEFGKGTIFQFDTQTSVLTTLHHFSGVD